MTGVKAIRVNIKPIWKSCFLLCCSTNLRNHILTAIRVYHHHL